MKLPNRENAYIQPSKLKDYLLSETHVVGRAKAKFLRAFGFDETNMNLLEQVLKINRGVPATLQKRYNALIAKRQAETLSKKEHDELLRMTSRIERLDVERMKYLVALARLRKKSLTTLMRELGVKSARIG